MTAFPAGFKAISGRTNQTALWACIEPKKNPVFSSDISVVPTCSGASHLMALIRFGQCWDGTSLDSTDHQSHLVFGSRTTDKKGKKGPLVCPADHPVLVPQVNISVHYPKTATGGSGVTLASGAPSTLHADIFEAWTGTSLQDRINAAQQPPAHRQKPPKK